MAVKKGKKKVMMGKATGGPMGNMSNMLHRVVAQNKYDIAPYTVYGKSREASGHAKHTKRK